MDMRFRASQTSKGIVQIKRCLANTAIIPIMAIPARHKTRPATVSKVRPAQKIDERTKTRPAPNP
ncbi:hypothetical protein ABAC402_04395 [Asticcacaulis sp. AC402]|nr:hypothetical protein ABAC402_04395 [Asticcacaulis sp. AC402]